MSGKDRSGRATAIQIYRDLIWFRVKGYGLWAKWGSSTDLHIVRQSAHYWGRLRWRTLRPVR